MGTGGFWLASLGSSITTLVRFFFLTFVNGASLLADSSSVASWEVACLASIVLLLIAAVFLSIFSVVSVVLYGFGGVVVSCVFDCLSGVAGGDGWVNRLP